MFRLGEAGGLLAAGEARPGVNMITASAANDQSGMDELTSDATHDGIRIAASGGNRRIRHTAVTISTPSSIVPPAPKLDQDRDPRVHSLPPRPGCQQR